MQFPHYLAILTIAATAVCATTTTNTATHHKAAATPSPQHKAAGVEHHVYKKLSQADLKHVASHLHKLSSSLELESKVASKAIKLHDKKAVSSQLHHVVIDTKASIDKATASIRHMMVQMHKRDATTVDLSTISNMFAKVEGASKLTLYLNSLKTLGTAAQTDIAHITSNVNLMTAIHSVVNVEQLMQSFVSGANSVTLLKNLGELATPETFVSAIKELECSMEQFITALKCDMTAVAQLIGSSDVVKYLEIHGTAAVDTLADMTGADEFLSQLKDVADSEKFVTALVSVDNIESMVNGFRAIPKLSTFVASVQSVEDMSKLRSVLSQLTSIVRRDQYTSKFKKLDHTAHKIENDNIKKMNHQVHQIEHKGAKLEHQINSKARREAEDLVTASLISVNTEIGHMIPKLEKMLHKLDLEDDVNSASTVAVTSLVPHFLEFTTVLTAAMKQGAPHLLPHINKVTKITDSMLIKLAHLQ